MTEETVTSGAVARTRVLWGGLVIAQLLLLMLAPKMFSLETRRTCMVTARLPYDGLALLEILMALFVPRIMKRTLAQPPHWLVGGRYSPFVARLFLFQAISYIGLRLALTVGDITDMISFTMVALAGLLLTPPNRRTLERLSLP